MVTVASTLVLSRLLTPTQVGVYSLCASLGTIATILRDFGVSEYLIQERELTRAKIRTAFGVALVVAWSLGATVYLSRHALASYFAEPGVASVLAVTALQFFILPLSSPAFALMNREMAFRRLFALQTVCNITQAATSLTLAWRGFGTMSLAWGPIASVAMQTLLLCWMRPRESLVWPAFSEWHSVLRFGSAYMSARLIETLAQNIHDPIIAKRFDFASVGLFSRAFGMVEMFRSNESLSVTEQRAVADGAERAELPDWMVKAIEAKKLTHLLIITRDRGDVSVRVAEGNTIGRGKAQGVGFYIDTLYTMRNPVTGDLSSGLLAGYAHLRLTLMDADSGAVLRRYEVHDHQAAAPGERSTGLDPWTYLNTADKVALLRNLVERGVGRGMTEMVR
jgi:hypothetical protein